MNQTLKDLLRITFEAGASDLHIGVGSPPQLRVDGTLRPVPNTEILTAKDTERLCTEVLSKEQIEKLESERELDLSFGIDKLFRIRANIFWQQGTITGAFRQIPSKIPSVEELGLPDIVMKLTERSRGLILVTGPTGCGKSTTMAAMIDRINEERHDHIITIEDPLEYIYVQRNCMIHQREIGQDTLGFARALKYILRQDPDVVLVGEMRDVETIQHALTTAETGHLVFATLHTNNAVQTVDRIVDVFPPHQQPQVRTQLSFVLEAVLSQQLLPKIGGGRILAQEIMIPNVAIRNLIREEKSHQIYSVIQVGQDQTGMVTMNQALANLVNQGKVEWEEALRCSIDQKDFRELTGRANRGEQPQVATKESQQERMKNMGRRPMAQG